MTRVAVGVVLCATWSALSGCAEQGGQTTRTTEGSAAGAVQPEQGTTTQPDYFSGQAGSMAQQDARATRTTPQPRENPRPNPIQQHQRSPVDQPRLR